jgi:hypothetical protein
MLCDPDPPALKMRVSSSVRSFFSRRCRPFQPTNQPTHQPTNQTPHLRCELLTLETEVVRVEIVGEPNLDGTTKGGRDEGRKEWRK